MHRTRVARQTFFSLLLGITIPAAVAAQDQPRVSTQPPPIGSDSVVVAADSSLAAGSIHRFFFGSRYRDLWATPFKVPVLEIERFDGGIHPVEVGGGMQTTSLDFENEAGREWKFRSVAKDARAILPETLRKSLIADVVNDQTSHAHPAGALVVPPLAEALGILHVKPQFGVMPDDPDLGEYREQFAGMLGLMEENADDMPDGEPGFAGSDDIISSLDLLEELREKPEMPIDAHAFLTARLLDFLINDWDRHKDQWDWAELERRGEEMWVPIPGDRDQAFFWADGLLPGIARFGAPKLIAFGPKIPLGGLTIASADLDRMILAELDRATWDSIAQFATERLTDSVIDEAVSRIPDEYGAEHEEFLATTLEARRDVLAETAMEYYDKLAQVVDVHASDEREIAEIEHLAGEGVRVVLRDGRDDPEAAERSPYFERLFVPEETKEVRVYLHGGDDSVMVRGAPEAVTVRVIGGKGANVAAAEPPSRRAAELYDFDAPPHGLTYGADTLFDRRPQLVEGNDTLRPPPDFGGGMAPFVGAGYRSDQGLVAGLGANLYTYGFRTWPYARRISFGLEYATGPQDARFDLAVDLPREGGGIHPLARAWASGLEIMRYYGQGNETARTGDGEFFRVDHSQYGAEVMLAGEFGGGTLEAGPAIQYSRTSDDPPRFTNVTAPYGSEDFGQLGGRMRWRLDHRTFEGGIPKGVLLSAGASVFPAIWDVATTFGDVRAEATTYLGLDVPFHPVLALRAGGRKLFGTYPFFESAFLGGAANLRGYDEQRFAGDAMAYGNAELRLRLVRMTFILPADIGVHGIADIGRVWAEGESSDEWHHAFGGGFWFGLAGLPNVLSVTIADGEERTGVYVETGFVF